MRRFQIYISEGTKNLAALRTTVFYYLTLFRAGKGPLRPPLKVLFCHCQTPQDIQLILGDFSLLFIAHSSAKINCRVRSDQVSREDLLTTPQKSLQSSQSQSFSRSDFLSSGIHYSTSMCNLYISEFVYL